MEGSFDFEPIDIVDARKALDQLPDGLVDPTTRPQFWVPRRRKDGAADRALTGMALDWLRKLPPIVRPHKLSAQFPRVTNAMADIWADKFHCEDLLASLLRDQRGERKGFAQDLQVEIKRLIAYRRIAP